jgi:hypothetical protein
MIWAITTPPAIPKPLELTSAAELAVQFNLKDEPVEPEKQTGKEDSDKGQGIKDPGAKDKKDMGGGKKIKGAEGQLGKQGPADKTELKGEIKSSLGGMSEVLSSEVGEEVKKTLGTISSVADALGSRRRWRRRGRALRFGNARHRLGTGQGRRLRRGQRWPGRQGPGWLRQRWQGRWRRLG